MEFEHTDRRTQTQQQTPTALEAATEAIATDTFRTLSLIHAPAADVKIVLNRRPSQLPSEAQRIKTKLFFKTLENKRDELQAVNPDCHYWIAPDPELGKSALFVTKLDGSQQRIIWDGRTIAPCTDNIAQTDDGKFELPVYPIDYSEWTACFSDRFTQQIARNGRPLPYAGVGISVLIETNDGMIPLTRRGLETPVYPGRLYSPGGSPKPGETTVESFVDEIVEETGLKCEEHFNPKDITVLAYVSDTHHAGSQHERPELVAYLKTDLSIRQIVEIRNQDIIDSFRPGDVWSLEPIIADPISIGLKVLHDGNQMCPPTEAALVHLMYAKLLEQHSDCPQNALEVIKKQIDLIACTKRKEHQPPIALADIDLKEFNFKPSH